MHMLQHKHQERQSWCHSCECVVKAPGYQQHNATTKRETRDQKATRQEHYIKAVTYLIGVDIEEALVVLKWPWPVTGLVRKFLLSLWQKKNIDNNN